MKKIFVLIVFLAVSCHSTYELHTETYKGKPILAGKATLADLEKKPYNEWFDANYRDYRPDSKIIEKLKPVINDYNFRVILGTWCGDSQEQVPVLFKVLDESGYHNQPVLYCVPRDYKSYPPAMDNNIIRVPTIIVLKKNKEIGRIIEYPMQSIEADLYKIMISKDYVHELMMQEK